MFNSLPVDVVYLILDYVDFGDLLHLKLVTKVPLFNVIKGRALTFRSRYEDVMSTMGIHFVNLAFHEVHASLDEGPRSFFHVSSITMYNCGAANCSVFRTIEAFLAHEQRYTCAKLIRE